MPYSTNYTYKQTNVKTLNKALHFITEYILQTNVSIKLYRIKVPCIKKLQVHTNTYLQSFLYTTIAITHVIHNKINN